MELMPPERPSRTTGWVLRLAVMMLAAAAAVGSRRQVSAGILGWDTTTAVLPGLTLTIAVTAPNVIISNTSTLGQCPVTGLGTDIIIYTCDPTGLGIPAGSHLLQTWTDPTGNPLTGPFSETVTYNGNPNGGATAPLVQSGPTPCTSIAAPSGWVGGAWDCAITPLPTQYPQTLTVYLLSSDASLLVYGLQGMTVFNNPNPNASRSLDLLGSCRVLSFPALTTSTFSEYLLDYNVSGATAAGVSPAEMIGGQQWGSELKAAYWCSDEGDAIPAPGGSSTVQTLNGSASGSSGSTLDFQVETSSTATMDFAQAVSYLMKPVTPTTQMILGPKPPAITSLSQTSGPAGGVLILNGTGLVAFAVTFGANPGRPSSLGPSRGTKVNFGTMPAVDVACSSDGTSCTVTIPSGGQPGDQVKVSVTNSAGTSNALPFTITAGNSASPGLAASATATPSATPAGHR
jgi:hypothetical protein